MEKKTVREWEAAYRRYQAASNEVARGKGADPVALTEFAEASKAVAVAWRRISITGGLPWWSQAALLSAVEAFEDQAQHWTSKAKVHTESEGSTEGHRHVLPEHGGGYGEEGAWFTPGGLGGVAGPGMPLRPGQSPSPRRRR